MALSTAPRNLRVRGEQWAQRLYLLASAHQEEFRRDRNLQAELLLQCLEEGRFTEPLDRHPPEGPLPRLPPHVVCALRRKRAERAAHATRRGSRPRGGRCHEGADFVQAAQENPFTSGGSGNGHHTERTSEGGSTDEDADDALRGDGFGGDVWSPAGNVPRAPRSVSSGGRRKPISQRRGTFEVRARRSTSSGSLAGAAACRLGDRGSAHCADGELLVGVSAPVAYKTLAARVVHLQDENRRLRRQLGQQARYQLPEFGVDVATAAGPMPPAHRVSEFRGGVGSSSSTTTTSTSASTSSSNKTSSGSSSSASSGSRADGLAELARSSPAGAGALVLESARSWEGDGGVAGPEGSRCGSGDEGDALLMGSSAMLSALSSSPQGSLSNTCGKSVVVSPNDSLCVARDEELPCASDPPVASHARELGRPASPGCEAIRSRPYRVGFFGHRTPVPVQRGRSSSSSRSSEGEATLVSPPAALETLPPLLGVSEALASARTVAAASPAAAVPRSTAATAAACQPVFEPASRPPRPQPSRTPPPASSSELVPSAPATPAPPASWGRAAAPPTPTMLHPEHTEDWPPSSVPPSPGPPPPEGDNEAFLRYLDEFRDYAGSLCAATPSRPETSAPACCGIVAEAGGILRASYGDAGFPAALA